MIALSLQLFLFPQALCQARLLEVATLLSAITQRVVYRHKTWILKINKKEYSRASSNVKFKSFSSILTSFAIGRRHTPSVYFFLSFFTLSTSKKNRFELTYAKDFIWIGVPTYILVGMECNERKGLVSQ